MIPFTARAAGNDAEKAINADIEKKVRHDVTPRLRHLEARMNAEPRGTMQILMDSRGRVTVHPKGYSADLTAAIEAVLASF